MRGGGEEGGREGGEGEEREEEGRAPEHDVEVLISARGDELAAAADGVLLLRRLDGGDPLVPLPPVPRLRARCQPATGWFCQQRGGWRGPAGSSIRVGPAAGRRPSVPAGSS